MAWRSRPEHQSQMAYKEAALRDWRWSDLWSMGYSQDIYRNGPFIFGNDWTPICRPGRQAQRRCSIYRCGRCIGNSDPTCWLGRNEITRPQGEASIRLGGELSNIIG